MADYAAFYRSGKGTPTSVMRRTIATIKNWENQGFVIFSSLLEADVLAQAAASDKRFAAGTPLSILDGVPIAFKDSILVAGHNIYEGKNPADPLNAEVSGLEDDVIVARFRELGAILVGVTVMVEGGVTPLGFNTHFHGPVNPYSVHRYSGGSSSGSAVAVATGLVPIAVGFDGGGSIRVPAALSGVHGLAVTFGRIAFNGCPSTLTKSGFLTASATDAAVAYAVLAPNAPGHHYSKLYDGDRLGVPTPHLYDFDNTQDLSDVRLGVFPEWFDDSDVDVRQRCRDTIAFLVSRGAVVVNITIPHLQWLSLSHSMKITSEFASHFDSQFHTRPAFLEPNTKITVGMGSSSSSLEVLSGEILRAYAYEYIRDLFRTEKLTCIVTPTVPMAAPFLADDAKSYGETNIPLAVKVIKYVFLGNFLGLPGYSVPVGFVEVPNVVGDNTVKGTVQLPVGLQLLGNHWQEHQLLRLAHSIEQGHTSTLPSFPTVHSFKPFETSSK